MVSYMYTMYLDYFYLYKLSLLSSHGHSQHTPFCVYVLRCVCLCVIFLSVLPTGMLTDLVGLALCMSCAGLVQVNIAAVSLH